MKRMDDLVRIMEIQYQSAQQSLHSIVKQELGIRQELKTLTDHTRAARKLGLNDEPEMRAMGADVVWERWLERSRAKLNLDLAKVLATKEMHLSRVRTSFGRLQAANAKSDQIRSAAEKRAQMQSLERTISHAILKD